MEKVTGKPAPDIKFFNMDVFRIAGCDVRALRHGMVGQPGWELFGPWEYGEAVRNAIVEAGQEYGIRQVGAVTYYNCGDWVETCSALVENFDGTIELLNFSPFEMPSAADKEKLELAGATS